MVDSLLALTAAQPELRKRLIIEITETHALKALDAANDLIGQLQAGGHTVCLDDFGAGAASLDYLRLLNVDVVKIDGRYIRTLTEAPRDRVIVQHVVNMCRDLGIAVIAEMIENEETARAVMRMGAALGQGWLFGKATPSLQWPTPSLPQGGDRSQPLEALEPARRIWTAG
jgi:EAL domain-containing protein (putative c-di-GMP-specific phosphodiesterase class I)